MGLGGSAVRDLLLRMRMSSSGWSAGLRRARSSLGKFKAQAATMLQAVKANWLAVAAAVYGTSRAISAAIRPASEWQDALMRMRVVSQGNVAVFEKMRALVDANAGGMFSRSDVAGALNYAKAVGFNIDRAGELLPLLRDTAAVYGEDLKTAMTAVIRAAKFGDAELAERIGLTLRENAILGTTMRLYKKRLGQLTGERKEIAVVTAAKEQLARASGGEEEAAHALSGATKKLKVAIHELTVDAVIPAIDPLTTYFNRLSAIVDASRKLLYVASLFASKEGEGGFLGRTVGGWARAAEWMGVPGVGTMRRLGEGYRERKAKEQRQKDQAASQSVYNQLTETAWPVDEEEKRYALFRAKILAPPTQTEEERFWDRLLQELGIGEEAFAARPGPAPLGAQPIEPIQPAALTEKTPEELDREHRIMNEAEIERMALEDRTEAWARYGEAVQATYGTAMDTVSVMLSKYLSREVSTHKKSVALWRWAGKHMAASVMQFIADSAKTQAMDYMARGLASLGVSLFGTPTGTASLFKAAAMMGGVAVVAGGAASAMEAGAQREMAAFGQEPLAGAEPGSAITGTGTPRNRRDIVSRISRAPETLQINVTTVFEGPNVVGADQDALRAFWDEHIKDWVVEGNRAGELAA